MGTEKLTALNQEILECQNMPYRLFCERYWMSEDIKSLRDREIAAVSCAAQL